MGQEGLKPRSGRPLRVLLFSSGNPDGTFLAAGLLHARLGDTGEIAIQGTGGATPSPEVVRALEEAGIDPPGWASQIAGGVVAEAVQVAVTICTPT